MVWSGEENRQTYLGHQEIRKETSNSTRLPCGWPLGVHSAASPHFLGLGPGPHDHKSPWLGAWSKRAHPPAPHVLGRWPHAAHHKLPRVAPEGGRLSPAQPATPSRLPLAKGLFKRASIGKRGSIVAKGTLLAINDE